MIANLKKGHLAFALCPLTLELIFSCFSSFDLFLKTSDVGQNQNHLKRCLER